MSEKNVTILDLDALLDMEMDKVETLPDYVTPGKSLLLLKPKEAGTKERKDKDGNKVMTLQIVYEIQDTLESDEPPFPNGSLFSDRFQASEDGIKFFKKQAMAILNVKDLDGAKMRDVFDGLVDAEPFKAAITVRTAKDATTGKEYTNISVRPLHEKPAA